MENASKALEMAAGVLLGVLIMSLIAYFFTEIGSWPQQQEDQKSTEQTAKFNLEYEVYDKKGMYGADVISCLTKAQNNNEKYCDGTGLSGNRYGRAYWINVYVNLKSNLKEEVIVYHFNPTTAGVYEQVQWLSDTDYTSGLVFPNNTYRLKDLKFAVEDSYTGLEEDAWLVPHYEYELDGSSNEDYININEYVDKNGDSIANPSGFSGTKYNAYLYDKSEETQNDNIIEITPLQTLLNTAGGNLKQIVTNTKNDRESLEHWSSAEWRTALYDFKTRKFKCDLIEYSDITGRVKKICFSEI